jgi:HEAT repeat protein
MRTQLRTKLSALALGIAAVSACVASVPQSRTAEVSTAGDAAHATAGAEVGRPEPTLAERTAHLDLVRRADFCARCHPEATAEHRLNTHGRAFTDPEVRLATAHFSIEGCIACHTPRPVFETGIGMNPIKRLSHLEEGNDCLSCHARDRFDFSTFEGGTEECKAAFDERVGTVEACASCHRNHGTPYQWENAEHGNLAGNTCVDCHMPEVTRPVAVGMPPRLTRRHTFFASRSESQLRRAYSYRARIDRNEVVVTIENAGAGHNFPTELKQRSVESLVIIRDIEGNEVARSRQLHRDPYKRPYGLTLPVNTQIPSGESREHRVPIPIANGSVETTLYYKLYYPIEDEHPSMTRVLETRSLPFAEIEPSTRPIESEPELHANLPEALPVEAASPGNLADFARPKIGKVDVTVPDGSHEGDIAKLIALFQFPVPQANREAQDVLVKLGAPAVPALIEALGSWDNKTWKQAQITLPRIGTPARSAVVAAIAHENLYARLHANEILTKFVPLGPDQAAAIANLRAQLRAPGGLDRASAAITLAALGAQDAVADIRPLLDDLDFDVAAGAARALGMLDDKESAPALASTLERVSPTVETGRDVAWALCAVGDLRGVSYLLDGLNQKDDLVRESIFEAYLDVTGKPLAYSPMLEEDRRLEELARLRNWWAEQGSKSDLRRPRAMAIPPALRAEVDKLVRDLGGNDVQGSTPEKDEQMIARLTEIGSVATPQLAEALKWPPGFAEKRAGILRVLAANPDVDALPALIEASRDPVVSVALWAVSAIENLRDPNGLRAVQDFARRFEQLAVTRRVPSSVGHPDDVRALVARARVKLGDSVAAHELLALCLSHQPSARQAAEDALAEAFGTPSANEPSVAIDVRRALDELPDQRARQIEVLQSAAQSAIADAERGAEQAATTQERLAVLAKFDSAEQSIARYRGLAPRAFAQDLERARLGADGLSAMLAGDAPYQQSLTRRDLLAPAERRRWTASGGVSARFEGSALVLEAAPDAGGSYSFGLGGTGSSAAGEIWRDSAFAMQVEIVNKGLWILDRYDPETSTSHATVMNVIVPTVDGVLYAPVAEGKSYAVAHSMIGSEVVHDQIELDASGAQVGAHVQARASTSASVRKGALVLQLEPGAKVVVRSLNVGVLRPDAAGVPESSSRPR